MDSIASMAHRVKMMSCRFIMRSKPGVSGQLFQGLPKGYQDRHKIGPPHQTHSGMIASVDSSLPEAVVQPNSAG